MQPHHHPLERWLMRMETASSLAPQALLILGTAGCGKLHTAELLRRHAMQHGHTAICTPNLHHMEEATLFETLQHVAQAPFQLFTAREDWLIDRLTPDVRSRLRALPGLTLPSPDEETLYFILQRECTLRQMRVSGNVLQYLAKRLPRNGHIAVQTVTLLEQKLSAANRTLTLPFVQSVLKIS